MTDQQAKREQRFDETWEGGPRALARRYDTGREADSSPEILAAMQAASGYKVVHWTRRLAFATLALAVATVFLGVATLVTG